MTGLLAWIDDQSDRLANKQWVGMEPRRRRWWALGLSAEALLVSLGFGWLVDRAVDDDMVWVFAALFAGWFTVFIWGVALRPQSAFKWALLSTPVVFGFVPLVLAFVNSR